MSGKAFGRARLGMVAIGVLLAWPAHAEQYDVSIVVDSEEEILDLHDNGDISDAERDRLLELFQDKVDVNRASRDELFELPGMTYRMADAIVQARQARGPLENRMDLRAIERLDESVIEQIRSFIRFPEPETEEDDEEEGRRVPIEGSVRFQAAAAPPQDDEKPAGYTELELTGWDGLVRAGWVGLVRERAGDLRLASSDAREDPFFVSSAPSYGFEGLAKAYLTFDTELGEADGEFHLGSFTAGFGERLVFDTTNRRRPQGLYDDDRVFGRFSSRSSYSSGFRKHEGLFGVGAEIEGIPLGEHMALDVTPFASWWRYDSFQYDFRPNLTFLSAEDAERYFSSEGGTEDCPLGQPCKHTFETFPDVHDRLVTGGNTRLHVGPRSHVGFTGYWAQSQFSDFDDEMTFSVSARDPVRDQYWSVGADFHHGVGIVDLFGEYARTDSGGNAALARSVVDLSPVVLEVAGRYYDDRFDNPFSRGSAAPSEFLGHRNRDEAGAEAEIVYEPVGWWRVLTRLDVWTRLSADLVPMEALVRNDFDPTEWLDLAVWLKYRDRDLPTRGRGQDYRSDTPDVDYEEEGVFSSQDPDGAARRLFSNRLAAFEDFPRGMRLDAGTRIGMEVHEFDGVDPSVPPISFTAYTKATWLDRAPSPRSLDIQAYDQEFQRQITTWFRAGIEPVDWLKLSSRVRWWNDELRTRERGNEFIEGFLRARFSFTGRARGYLRYDVRKFFTDAVTLVERPDGELVREERSQKPQHLLRATVTVDF